MTLVNTSLFYFAHLFSKFYTITSFSVNFTLLSVKFALCLEILKKHCVNFKLISVKFALFRTTISSLGFCFVNIRPSIELGMCYLEDMQIRKNIATGLSGHKKLGWGPES